MEEQHKSLSHENVDNPEQTTDLSHDDDPVHTSSRPPNQTTTLTEENHDDPPLPESSQTVFRNENGTYIVRVPRDRIYRVPPPGNALRLEQRTRNERKEKKRSGCCCCCCLFRSK